MGNPTVTPLYEQWHDFGFIVSEANGHQSRETVTLAGGAKVYAGTVLGQNSTDGTYHPLNEGASDGTETPAAILCATKDVTSANKPAVVMKRNCEVNGAELIWPAGITTNQTTAAVATLATAGILVR